MRDADGEELPPSGFYDAAPEGENGPAAIAARLVDSCDEFVELRVGQPVILFLMRATPKVRNGRTTLGEMALPSFKGPISEVGLWLLARSCGGSLPDFVCSLCATWWAHATPRQREALVHHEMKHCGIKRDREGEPRFDDDGKPEWGLQSHDLEEFCDTVRRYGDWLGDVAPFLLAAREGGVE